jgi:hypothetical protein
VRAVNAEYGHMDDVVALIATDSKAGRIAFLTWGRLLDPVDEELLASIVRPQLCAFGLNAVTSLEVCYSLRDVASGVYFYEALLSFVWRRPTFGDGYESWRDKTKMSLLAGSELYCIGPIE